ncbi:MAG: alpha/beta hydrolase [Cyanobacteria bacterium J06581_3]
MTINSALQQFTSHYAGRWSDAVTSKSVYPLHSSSPSQTQLSSEQDTVNVLTSWSPTLHRSAAGNHAKVLHHGKATENVIVLIHGLTDSPFYMQAIAEDFATAGFNVVLPLLPAHGLQRPGRAFRQLQYSDWCTEVDAMCNIAAGLGHRISMGGLSTGGALCVHKAIRSPGSVTGGLFLYSAALDIGTAEQLLLQTEAGRIIARLSDQTIWLEKTVKDQLTMILDDQKAGEGDEHYGIGENPYKYSVLFYEGASQLAEVIQNINQYYATGKAGASIVKFSDLKLPLFIVHSTTDQSAKFRGVKRLIDNHPGSNAILLALRGIPHASVVLNASIVANADHEEYAPANPHYLTMSAATRAFIRQYLCP